MKICPAMRVIKIIAVVVALFALASLLAVFTYGRFAEEARGAPSMSLAVSGQATALDRVIAPLLAQHPGKTGLVLLSDNLHAFAARAALARNAGRSLDLQYYYWRSDLTGALLMKEVIAAADRGVRVRILLDDINANSDDAALLAPDRHSNIEVRLFNPSRARSSSLRRGFEMLLRAYTATRRMHNKSWIADGQVALIGGRNIGDAYFDASRAANFRDMDLGVIGPAVAEAATIFDSFWNSAAVLPVATLSSATGDLPALRISLHDGARAPGAAPYIARVTGGLAPEPSLSGGKGFHWTASAKVVSDPPHKALGNGSEDWLGHAIFPTLMSARARLDIISPYFIPGDEGVDRLRSLVQRGVQVAVLTNSLAATDVAAVHGAYAHYREPLLEAGVALFELRRMAGGSISLFGSSGASLHTKAFLVDSSDGFVGSFNFDPRSLSLNTEMRQTYDREQTHDALHGDDGGYETARQRTAIGRHRPTQASRNAADAIGARTSAFRRADVARFVETARQAWHQFVRKAFDEASGELQMLSQVVGRLEHPTSQLGVRSASAT